MSKSLKIGKYRVIDMINPVKWWAFIIGRLLAKYVTFEYCEQVVYRSVICFPCLKDGSCMHCGCDAKGAFMAPNNFCSQGNFSGMMSKKDWNKYKETTGFGFNVHIDMGKNK